MNTKSTVIHQDDCEWVSRENYKETTHGRVRWKTLLSADQTATAEITMGLAELPPGEQLQLHSHAQAETYYILSGEGFVLLNGERQAVQAGSVVFIPGDVVHTIGAVGDQPLQMVYTFPVDWPIGPWGLIAAAIVVQDPLLEARVGALEAVEHLGDGAAVHRDLGLAGGQRAQGGGDSNGDAHGAAPDRDGRGSGEIPTKPIGYRRNRQPAASGGFSAKGFSPAQHGPMTRESPPLPHIRGDG